MPDNSEVGNIHNQREQLRCLQFVTDWQTSPEENSAGPVHKSRLPCGLITLKDEASLHVQVLRGYVIHRNMDVQITYSWNDNIRLYTSSIAAYRICHQWTNFNEEPPAHSFKRFQPTKCLLNRSKFWLQFKPSLNHGYFTIPLFLILFIINQNSLTPSFSNNLRFCNKSTSQPISLQFPGNTYIAYICSCKISSDPLQQVQGKGKIRGLAKLTTIITMKSLQSIYLEHRDMVK